MELFGPVRAPLPVTVCRLRGPAARGDVEDVCRRFGELIERHSAPLFVCEVGSLTRADMTAVDVLARMQLLALRSGSQLRLWRAPTDLVSLLDLVGLSRRVPVWGA
jgi:hypothetical protein